MSDITKKIFSIEPETGETTKKRALIDVIHPSLDGAKDVPTQVSNEDVPDFVTRDVVQPLIAPPQYNSVHEPESLDSGGWFILGFSVLYVIGAGLYFGLPRLSKSLELMSISGLILLLILPLILLYLLWRSLRHLAKLNQQNAQFSKAADILVSPDREAFSRTETLASGIQSQISKVNNNLDKTVETLKDVQIAVTRETQALDAAGLQLTNRSEDVGRNLTLQRQALESISGTFDTRMETLSSQISTTSDTLEVICTEAEAKLLKAGEDMQIASGRMDQTVANGSKNIAEKIEEIESVRQKLDDSSIAFAEGVEASTKNLMSSDEDLSVNAQKLQELNATTQSQISDLHNLIRDGNQMLLNIKDAASSRATSIDSYYENLATKLKKSEDETLVVQGQTAQMVESNLAQMRRDFSRMETDLQALQAKLRNVREETLETLNKSNAEELKPARLNLMPLDSDFPPVEPPRFQLSRHSDTLPDTPLSLGVDMEIETTDSDLTNFEPELIRRPGSDLSSPKTKGFGRRTEKDEKASWRWRDMLGTIDRPTDHADSPPNLGSSAPASPNVVRDSEPFTSQSIDGVGILTKLKLSPSAIVDEGTVVEATQAHINNGEAALITAVSQKLPEAVQHLKANMDKDPLLAGNLRNFSQSFAQMIGNTPPTAPALRAALGSPDGRAYLLSVAALKG